MLMTMELGGGKRQSRQLRPCGVPQMEGSSFSNRSTCSWTEAFTQRPLLRPRWWKKSNGRAGAAMKAKLAPWWKLAFLAVLGGRCGSPIPSAATTRSSI
ncbi:hypothetical protein BHM03_00046647, partial [Ensete ventricosum]